MSEQETLADRLRASREQQNMSQQALAVAAGVNGTVVSRLERGRTQKPSTATLQLLAYALDVDPVWLRDGGDVSSMSATDVRLLEQPAQRALAKGIIGQRLSDRVGQQPRTPDLGDTPSVGGMRLAALAAVDGRVIATLSCQAEIGPVSIGRGSEAQVRIADAYASRVHATIAWDDTLSAHVLSDAGSANGTYVNGRRVAHPTPLRSGVTIRLGRTELRYVLQ